MKYLVTGAAGFIGYHLSKRLLEAGHQVIGIDNINDYYSPDLKYARLNELGIARVDAELEEVSVFFISSVQSEQVSNICMHWAHIETN